MTTTLRSGDLAPDDGDEIDRILSARDGQGAKVTLEQCIEINERADIAESLASIAESMGIPEGTVGYHSRLECTHEHRSDDGDGHDHDHSDENTG